MWAYVQVHNLNFEACTDVIGRDMQIASNAQFISPRMSWNKYLLLLNSMKLHENIVGG